tara:strand:- start:577 stop:1734 length:1158 start_codon:yes stop_codon:yes gene_type:complete
MSISRLKYITKIGVEQMGDLANSLKDPSVLRLENLDTNISPPKEAIEHTREAVYQKNSNSYLPFIGKESLRKEVTNLVNKNSGQNYDWKTESIISAGGLSGILNALLATLEPGDEVLLTDPTYVGLINRVRLAGGIPHYVPLIPEKTGWRLDLEALSKIETSRIKVALLMSPSMPTGAVFNMEEWTSLINFCKKADCWLINDSAMERILFDKLKVIHPATFDGMRDRVITIGSASKEYRMIGWRVGWIVGTAKIIEDIARISITNVVCQTGIAMEAVAKAMTSHDDGILNSAKKLEKRRDFLLQELSEYQLIPPHGGWSLLVDVSKFGLDGSTASARLLKKGKIAATPMINWGSKNCEKYVRLVFSNESINRLKDIKDRFKKSFD